MSMKNWAEEIAGREGKISQVSIGNIREVLGILSDLFYEKTDGEDYRILNLAKEFADNGKNRSKRRKK